jgi:hypothetical protein
VARPGDIPKENYTSLLGPLGPGEWALMYIGVGTLVIILVVVAIIYLARRA